MWTDIKNLWTGEVSYSQVKDLAFVEQNNIQIKVLNKGNTYLSSMRFLDVQAVINSFRGIDAVC